MIQDQLTDYISSQIKLGVSRDAIKSALVSAGWVAADVEDTLKKVDGGSGMSVGMATAQPAMATKPTETASVSSVGAGAKMSGSQMIRVSDLVSTSPVAKSSPSQMGGKISGNNFEATPAGGGGSGSKTMLISWSIAGVLVVLFAGLAWYFYAANAGLASQVSSLTSQSTSVNTQLSTLKSQLDASSTASAAEIATLSAANADLALDLSFYAVPAGGSASSTAVTLNGTLSGGFGKTLYIITTTYGAKIFVANSADATISAALKPFMGVAIQVSGTYIPGSDAITVSSVSSSTTP